MPTVVTNATVTANVSTDEESAPSLGFSSPFDSKQDEAPDPVLATYDVLCPGGSERDADEDADGKADIPVEVRAAPSPATAPAAPPVDAPPVKKKRRKRGSGSFETKKGKRQGSYQPISPSSRKRKARRPRKPKKPVFDTS